MAQAGQAGSPQGDPRILKVQLERAAKSIGGAATGSPVWVAFLALMCSDPVPYLGNVGLNQSAGLVSLVTGASLLVWLVLRAYRARPDTLNDTAAELRWNSRLLGVCVLLSFAWGFAPWLLWENGNATNHVFIALMLLAIVSRFLVVRANHVPFFLASFGPMGAMLFARFALTMQPMDLVLAILVPLYAVQIFLDSVKISGRWDEEARMNISHQDMSRELAEARDEALLKRAEAENANASKTAFLANISHELRTPLNAILGFSEIIARECLGPVGSPRYKEYAGDIHNSGAHLLSLINDLLDVAKIEAGRMEIEPHMIDTEATLESALKFVSVKARERKQALTITVDGGAALLYADERAVKQIVINLVSNAVKFTHDGGRIEVHARRNGIGEFELTVADNGPGIPKEKVDRIFKPFSRVDNRYDSGAGGTGLGLALVRGLAELHGGRAAIESETGKGTRVYVILPTSSVEKARRLASA